MAEFCDRWRIRVQNVSSAEGILNIDLCLLPHHSFIHSSSEDSKANVFRKENELNVGIAEADLPEVKIETSKESKTPSGA